MKRQETMDKFKIRLAALENYTIRDNILLYTKNGRTAEISNFIPFPVEEITYADGYNEERHYILSAYLLNDDNVSLLPQIKVKASAFANMGFIIEQWGLSPMLFPPMNSKKDHIRYIINKLGTFAKKRKIYIHTGWQLCDNKYCYLTNGGAIGCDSISVEMDGRLSKYRIGHTAEAEEKKKTLEALLSLSDKSIIYPLIAITFLSPLNEFFRQCGHEPAFILYLLGRTQSKKSTLAALFLSFYGNFTCSTLPCSFKDTLNALEKKCFYLKDVLTVIDDYHPVTHYRERQEMEQKAQYLSRGYGDRTAKDRLRSDTTLNNGYIPRGNAIITGEDFPNIGQSGAARNFIIEIKPNDISNLSALSQLQQAAEDGVLSSIMCDYIIWLLSQAEKLSEKIKQNFLSLRFKAYEDNIAVMGRTGDIVAWLSIGIRYFCQFCELNSLISAGTIAEIKTSSWSIFSKLSLIQNKKSNDEKPTNMFISAIREMIESGEILLINKTEKNQLSDKPIVGYYDTDYYYFLPSSIFSKVNGFYSRQGIVFPLTKTRIFNMLADENLIIIEANKNGKSNTKQVRINGEKSRYLTFDKKIISET